MLEILINFSVVKNLPAYNKLYAWMHRISNAKLNDLEEDTEWWLYESCDGPTCGPDRGTTTTVATTTDASAACDEAQKALSAEENSLAKIPLQLACETACAGEAGATCGQSKGLSKCYECFEAGSVDKKEPCFKNPASVFDLSVTEQTCTTDKGCYIKRREQTDEYGDVTWLDL